MGPIKFIDLPAETKELEEELRPAIDRVLASGRFILGPEVSAFEKKLADYLDIKHVIGVGNGMEALQISLMSQSIGPGDEVITTPVSAVATTLAILAVGATPIFVGIDPTGQIDPKLVELAITPKTKAVLPVHLYGHPAYPIILKEICFKHHIFLIEDAAQAIGSSFKGRKLGTIGDIGCFSFYPTKNLGAYGDGGAIATGNDKIAEICRQIRDYGQSGKYIHIRLGLNSRLDELQAVILSVKLDHLDKFNQKRHQNAQIYKEALSEIPGLYFAAPDDWSGSNFHLFVIKTDKRDQLKNFLASNGIPTDIHYPRMIPDQPLFESHYSRLSIPRARRFTKTILSLPCHPFLEVSQVEFIADKIHEFFR